MFKTTRRKMRILTTGLAVIAFCAMPVTADTTIDSNSFTYVYPKRGAPPVANDFHMTIGGRFLAAPESDVFPNRNHSGGTANFSGQNLANGGSHNVKFKSSGSKPKPRGYFTRNGVKISNRVRSKALDGTNVAWVPSEGGFDGELTLLNDFGSYVTGSVDIYVNTGFDESFTLQDFDTLRNARLIMSEPDYFLGQDEGFEDIQIRLESPDEYLLIVGTANAGDGLGDFPFAIGTSPIPEPASLALLSVGGLGLLLLRRRASRRL